MHPEQPAPEVPRREIVVVALWCALVSGLLEAGVVMLRQEFLGKEINLSYRFIWMIPVMNLVWFGGMALVLAFLAFVVRIRPRLLLWCLIFLGFLLVALVFFPGFHWAAGVVLAAGIALRAAQILAKRWSRVFTLARGTLPWLALALLLVAAGMEIVARVSERRKIARLPAAVAGAPNVLLLVLDTVREWNLSLYGYERSTTPALEEWSRRGTIFDLAVSTAPWTLPSHASMFTGRWPYELSTSWSTPLDDAYPTLAERLAQHGYRTGGFVANLLYCSRQHGLNRGFTRYEDFPVSPGEFLVSSSLGRFLSNRSSIRRLTGYYDMFGRKTAADINRSLLDWIPDREGRPFFAFLNYYDAHEPYLPPDSLDQAFSSGVRRKNHLLGHELHEASRSQQNRMTPDDIRGEVDAYDGSIAYLDQQIDLLFRELERRGILEQTLIILTSDHGEHFGEHKLFGHGHRLYRPSLEVPLVLLYPGKVPAGQRVSQPVSLRDIPATVLDLLGLPQGDSFPGSSLSRYWRESPDGDLVLSEVYRGRGRNYVSAFAEGMHYLRNPDGSEEVYALDDRMEERNLAADSTMNDAVSRLRASIPAPAIRLADRKEGDLQLD